MGFPVNHAKAFQIVANQKRCIIMSRAVGKACTGLIEESYASKGFHVKAKSCNWGPMEGFVVEDPNLTKRQPGDFGKQWNDLVDAFAHGAKSVPLYISNHRRSWLDRNGYMTIHDRSNLNAQIYRARQRDDNDHIVRSYEFKLKRCTGSKRPRGATTDMWSVYYHNSILDNTPIHTDRNVDDESNRVRAMVDSMGDPKSVLGYRAAMTGDYDLFALWVHKSIYRPDNVDGLPSDNRMVTHSQLEQNIRNNRRRTGEDKHLGNVTGRLRQVRDALNLEIRRAGYRGGNMVHHSDEAGRPFVRDIDLPVIAFVPGRKRAYGLTDIGDIREFINVVAQPRGYVASFNPGWMSELVFNVRGFDPNSLQLAKTRLTAPR